MNCAPAIRPMDKAICVMHLRATISHFLKAMPRSVQNSCCWPISISVFTSRHACNPNGVRLRLGDDLSAGLPASLKQITNPDLKALLNRVDPMPDSLHESGAVDWADLPDRLHFIVDMFRCYQESHDLLELPFTPDQVVALKSGRLPDGQL